MRQTTTAITVILITLSLCVSEAAAYGGGGFYGSGRDTGFSIGDHFSVADGKAVRHWRAPHRNEGDPVYW